MAADGAHRTRILAALMPLAVAACVSDIEAQPAVQLQVSSGSATDQRGTRSAALTVAPVVTLYDTPQSSVSVFASGTQFSQSARSLAVGTSVLLQTSPTNALGAQLAADGVSTSTTFGARFTTFNAAPSLVWRVGVWSLDAGVRAANGRTTLQRPLNPRDQGVGSLLDPPTNVRRISESRFLWGPQVQAAALWTSSSGQRAARITLSYGSWRAANAAMPDVGTIHDVAAHTTVVIGRVTTHATTGRRFQRDAADARMFASAHAVVTLTRNMALTAGAGRYLSDPVSGALGGRFLTAGLTLTRRRESAARTTPIVRGAEPPPPRTTRVLIRAADASAVEVAGDWNDWKPHPTRRAQDGVWYADVTLAPGEYRYAFLIDGREWRVPEHTVATNDGLGGKVAWLSVRTPAR